ncbi:putative transcriptional regulatory protein C1F7.11c [Hypsizygus marmoreus]|uniref:Transcriptional regulatory protein C1F7.11c n=1 Tax=Hypsizygus marmoreus TaxID=39966 RepID=A0A369JMX1_HYPMA|nr:putative transcriptional regulatory protein C1F7.11c [Hypsizygus marmoreus]
MHSSLVFESEALSAIASASTSVLPNAANNGNGTGNRPSQKRKRNRAVLSCRPCHERKQQCDRAQPCSRCASRETGHECVYFEHIQKMPKIREDPVLLEATGAGPVKNMIPSTLRDVEPTALAGLEALLQLVQASNVVTGAGTGTERNLTADQAVHIAASALGQLSRQAPNKVATAGPMAEILQQIRLGAGHAQQLPSNAAPLTDLRTHFPNHAITAHLLYHFFEHSSIPWLWPIIYKPVFDTCYITFSSGPQSPPLDFLALLAILCASSLQFLPEGSVDPAFFYDYGPGRDVLKQRLFEFSRSILYSDDSAPPSLERIQAMMLLATYQLNEGNLVAHCHSSAISVRMAQLLSMNTEACLSKLNPVDAEMRRKIWWTLFIHDRYETSILRRPYMIYEQHCDVEPPHNLDHAEIQTSSHLQSKPLNHPTETTFQILQIQWARLLGKIWDTCFAARGIAYSEVFSLEGEIQKFELDLPASFRSQTLQGAIERPYIAFQNRILTLQMYHTRAIIMRPFLRLPMVEEPTGGRDEKLGNFHAHAKYVCVMFCKRLLAWQILAQTQMHRAQLSWTDLIVRIFDAALTLAVAIVSDSSHEQIEELKEWISIAQDLLRDLGVANILASKAQKSLEVIRRRIRIIVQPAFDPTSDLPAPVAIAQYVPRATQTIAQPQPSLTDLFDLQSIAEPIWQERIKSYLGFPGIELFSGDDLTSLELFLDSCVPPHAQTT